LVRLSLLLGNCLEYFLKMLSCPPFNRLTPKKHPPTLVLLPPTLLQKPQFEVFLAAHDITSN